MVYVPESPTGHQRLEAYDEGRKAARAGAPYRLNPFKEGSDLSLRCCWSAGYWDERDLLLRILTNNEVPTP